MEIKSEQDRFNEPFVSCPICNSPQIAWWANKIKKGVTFSIWKCENCFSGFLNPRPVKQWLEAVYAESGHGLLRPITFDEVLAAEKEYPNTTLDAERLLDKAIGAVKAIAAKNKVLDIGSGYGFYSAAALRRNCSVDAVNPSIWENDVYQQMNGFRPMQVFFEDARLNAGYNVVVVSQVLEHVTDPAEMLAKIRGLMAPGGILAMAVPNVNSFFVKIRGVSDNSCFWVPEHQNYFTLKGFSMLLERCGFEVLESQMVSRIPYFAVSRRLGLKGVSQKMSNQCVRIFQTPVCAMANLMGFGLYINLWARVKDK